MVEPKASSAWLLGSTDGSLGSEVLPWSLGQKPDRTGQANEPCCLLCRQGKKSKGTAGKHGGRADGEKLRHGALGVRV